VRIEASPGGQANGIIFVEPVDGRLEFHHAERRARADLRFLPQAAMQIHLTRMRFVVARPLNAFEFLEAPITHARMHRTEPADFVPNAFRSWLAPVVAQTTRQLVNDLDVAAHTGRRLDGATATLHAALAGGHGALGLAPAGRRRP